MSNNQPVTAPTTAVKPAVTNGAPVAAANVPTTAELLKRIADLEAAAAARSNTTLTLKVSEKGALSVYGLGKFPVTLYAGAWERIFAAAETFKTFIAAHPELARKVAK